MFKTNATLEIARTCTVNGPTIMDKSPRTFLHLWKFLKLHNHASISSPYPTNNVEPMYSQFFLTINTV